MMQRLKYVMRFRRAMIAFAAATIALSALASSSLAQTRAQIDWNKIDSEALDYFRTYLRFDTTNPPSNTAAAIAYLKAILDQEGIATQTFQSKPGMVTLVARIPGPAGVKPLMLMSHADVVPAVGANWTHHPFDADLTGGYVWARGAIDNKAHGIMALMTMLALKRNGVALRRGVEMMVNPDEEAGGENGAAWMVKNHWDAIDPAFAFNEGGDGAPGWLGIKGITFQVAVSEKRVNWLHVSVRGKGGHGSVPKPDNPNLILINALHRLLEKQPPIRITRIFADAMESIAPLEPFPASFELAHLESARDGSSCGGERVEPVQYAGADARYDFAHDAQRRIQGERRPDRRRGRPGLPSLAGHRCQRVSETPSRAARPGRLLD